MLPTGAEASDPDQALKSWREKIDDLDEQIQALISERAHAAVAVAKIKRAQQDALGAEAAEHTAYFRPEREAEVLKRVIARNTGPLDDEEVARLFRQIMSSCLALEAQLKIAYLGPAGTFTQQAALKHFGHAVNTIPLGTIDEVFREVEAGAAHFGVVPVENSTEGIVNTTLDAFMDSSVRVCGEVELRVRQHLLVGENTRTDAISRVYSHPQSLAQCRKWLDAHMPGVERYPVTSNADAARRVKSEWNAAAIAGDMAAEQYGLTQYASNIEDNPCNSTRFLVIGLQHILPCGDDKTSILVEMKNRPGALLRVLQPFEDAKLSLTRIETRPSRNGDWTYVFFIDFEGHEAEDVVQAVFSRLQAESVELKRLGSYPKAVL
ncbi:MAG: prephenate dehydratase [Gammaproteobacteria bacterium]